MMGCFKKIHTKILFLIIAICLFAVCGISTASYLTVKGITEYSIESNRVFTEQATKDANEAMLSQTRHFMQLVADGQASNCEDILKDISFNVLAIEGAVKDIFNHPEHYDKGRPIINQRDVAPGEYSNTWIFPENLEMTPGMEKEISLMSNLEVIMPALVNNANILELYVGLESGLLYSYTSVNFDDPKYDARKRPWYLQALERPGETFFTDVYTDAFKEGKVVTCTSTVHNKNGEVLGVVGVDVQLESLSNLILETKILENGYAFILDSAGGFVVRPDTGREEDWDEVFKDGFRQMTEGKDGYVVEEVDGKRVYLTFSHISFANWSVGVIVSEDEILSSLNRFSDKLGVLTNEKEVKIVAMSRRAVMVSILVCIAVIAMVVVVSLYLAYIVSRPINNLTKEIKKLEKTIWNIEFRWKPMMKSAC